MFLKKTIRKNKALIKYAFELHQNKIIAPNTYLVDLDALLSNAKKTLEIAKSNNIDLLYLSKQFSHIPIIAKELEALGYSGIIVNDYKDLKKYQTEDVKINSIGYFSQVPNIALETVVNADLDFVTVYSLEKIKFLNNLAKTQEKVINIVIRVSDLEKDLIIDNQIGGFLVSELPGLIKAMKNLQHIKIVGITSYPCFVFYWFTKEHVETPNFFTLKKAQAVLKELGIDNLKLFVPTSNLFESNNFIAVINPGEKDNSLQGLSKLAKNFNKHQEIPSCAYITEVSHNYNGQAFIYSNKIYFNSNLVSSIAGDKITNYHHYNIQPFTDNESIYYLKLDKKSKIGNTVILAFDWQMLTNKAHVAIISGIQNKNPKLRSIYNCNGDLISDFT